MLCSPATLVAVLRRLALATALVVAAPAGLALAAPPASPASAPATLVIIADAPASRQAVAGLGGQLPAPWRVGDDAALRKALAAAGQRTPAGVALGNPAARAALVSKARQAAREVSAQAVLFVRVTPRQRNTRLVTLVLVAPGAAEPLVDTTIEASTTDDGAAVLSALAPTLAGLAPAESAPPSGLPPSDGPAVAPAPGPADAAAAPPPKALGAVDRTVFVFSAGGGSAARVFRYHDGLSPALRTYDLAASPNLVLAAEVYPLARLGVPIVRRLGLYGGFQRALGVSSQTSTGTTVSTTWWRAEGGLRFRVPFGEEDRFVLGVDGGVVKERFSFTGAKTLTAWLPDVDYFFWRAGLDGRLRAGPLGLLAQAAYLPAIQGGAVADRFRQTSFSAVELGFGLAVPIVPIFELRATAVYTRVFYSFHPEVGDLYVAGGALDHLVRAQLLATLVL
jgi:hypothetical protein